MISLDQPGAAVIFAATIGASLLGLYAAPQIVERCLFRPYWFFRRRQYDTIYMSSFVHADLGHLFMNMLTYYFFAFPMEGHIGTARFLVLYFAGVLVSHAYTYLRHKDEPDYASLGASGAVAAVSFAYVVYFPTSTLMVLPLPIPIPAPLFAIGFVAYSYWAARGRRGRVNHDAHLSGALVGIAFVALTDPHALAGLARLIS